MVRGQPRELVLDLSQILRRGGKPAQPSNWFLLMFSVTCCWYHFLHKNVSESILFPRRQNSSVLLVSTRDLHLGISDWFSMAVLLLLALLPLLTSGVRDSP